MMSNKRTQKIKQKKIVKATIKKLSSGRALPHGGKFSGVRGKGGYFSDAVNWGKKAWRNLNENQRPDASRFNNVVNQLGQTIGGEFGVGKQLGNAASWVSRALGMGKYEVKENSLASSWGHGVHLAGNHESSPPKFYSNGNGSDIVFAHSEFVTNIKSSIDFKSKTYAINPGNPILFPWASKIGRLYEEFKMLGMLIEYRPTSGTSNTSAVPGMGTVMLATDYDVYDHTFSSKRAMNAAEFSSSGTPYDTILHAIECDSKRNVLSSMYVQPGLTEALQATGDARFSILGNTTIATEGQQADDVVMGELYVTYHWRLSRPTLEDLNNSGFSQLLVGTMTDTQIIITSERTAEGPPFHVVPDGPQFRISNPEGQTGIYKVDCFLKTSTEEVVTPLTLIPNFSPSSHATLYNLYHEGYNQPTTYGGITIANSTQYGSEIGALNSFIVEITGPTTIIASMIRPEEVLGQLSILITQISPRLKPPPVISTFNKLTVDVANGKDEIGKVEKMIQLLVEENKRLNDKFNFLTEHENVSKDESVSAPVHTTTAEKTKISSMANYFRT